jgi:hypothetical protein
LLRRKEIRLTLSAQALIVLLLGFGWLRAFAIGGLMMALAIERGLNSDEPGHVSRHVAERPSCVVVSARRTRSRYDTL